MLLMKNASIWQQAQSEELNCWVQISHKLDNDLYIARKKAYWQRILAKARLSPERLATKSVLEVGAGPSGIFLLFPEKADFVSLDPLNNQYTQLAPHLYHQQTVVTGPLETFATERQFDVVLAINCIDHSEAIDLFIQKLAAVCDGAGTAVLAVNCHQTRWGEWIWQHFQSILEPHHPYHFTEANYTRLLLPHFQILHIEDIEDDIIWINNETSDAKIPSSTPPQATPKRQLWHALLSGRAVALLFMRLLAWLGWPAHDFAGNGRSLYRHKLFILTPKAAPPP